MAQNALFTGSFIHGMRLTNWSFEFYLGDRTVTKAYMGPHCPVQVHVKERQRRRWLDWDRGKAKLLRTAGKDCGYTGQ